MVIKDKALELHRVEVAVEKAIINRHLGALVQVVEVAIA
jgi:hypothetical protein